jgi:hypothetical protein
MITPEADSDALSWSRLSLSDGCCRLRRIAYRALTSVGIAAFAGASEPGVGYEEQGRFEARAGAGPVSVSSPTTATTAASATARIIGSVSHSHGVPA